MGRKQKRAGLELKKNWPGYLLLAPAVTAVLALSIYPLFRGIYLSFVNYNLVRPKDSIFNTFAGLENYKNIFANKIFLQSIGNTVKWTLVNLVIQLVAAMLLALALNMKLKGRSVYRTLILVPWAVPHAIAAMTFTFLYNANVGIINILLVDIQEKLQAGKGAGYARWAKVFNLKQMAQTMNYLTEHGLLEYAVLEEKAAAATTRHNELSAQIKAAETRMAEIAVLRTHIINYVKTREIYAAYRKAGYSKKFLAEHEADILLHKAAKQAFDDLGIKKLPTVKSLQAEYAQLLEGKKKDYAEYRRSREEMRELLAAKANVDRLMGYGEERQNDREKEPEQDR